MIQCVNKCIVLAVEPTRTATSHPPGNIHIMNAPFPVFAGLPLLCIIVNANGR